LEINKNHVGVNIDFKDPDTNLYFDPISTSVTVSHNSVAVALSALKILVPFSRRDDTTGIWGMEFLTTDMTTGTWVFTFSGVTAGGKTVSHVLTFTAADIPVEQYFIGTLRTKLGDKRASRYMLDDNMRFRWTNGELFSFLEDARADIGQTPPSPMEITYPQAYAECHELMLVGGFIFALEAMGIFSTFNKMNYNDELSLQIDRSMFFQNAQSLKQNYEQMKLRWKRDNRFHAVRGIGMASGRFPLYTSRIISLSLANSQSMFGAY
jgi:hypothetical protein